MPITVRIDGLDELLDQQFSVVSRRQLLVLGMKDNAMQYRVRVERVVERPGRAAARY